VMRPTTKDLAKAAGVSLATVDRVLNDRPGVREDTVKIVHEMIEKIGFIRNLSAANLARSRSYRFLFLVPRTGDQFLAELIARVAEANTTLASDMSFAEVAQIHESDPHQIADYLSALDPQAVDGVAIMAPESPQARDAKAQLRRRGIETVTLISGQTSGDEVFVGIDNHAAGATAGRLMGRFLADRRGKLMVIAETMRARDSLERRLGFDEIINADYPQLNVLPSLETHGDPDRTERVLAQTLASHSDICGIYLLGSEARLPLQKVAHLRPEAKPIIIAHERTPFTEAGLRSGQIDALITQDPGHLVRSAVRIMRARCDRREVLASQEKIRIEILLSENL
jgi:LacI family transcriptional regulator